MPEWLLAVLAGASGSLVGEYIRDRGFALPRTFVDKLGQRRWDPGVAFTPVIGAVTGVAVIILAGMNVRLDAPAEPRSAVGAFLVALGGDALLRLYLQNLQLRRIVSETGDVLDKTVSLVSDGDGEAGEREGTH